MAEKKAGRTRLDVEMARRGLAPSRERARRFIMAGRVRVDSRPAGKPDLMVGLETDIVVIGGGDDYASRAAHKLIAALDNFGIDPAGRFALDIGASTGGFTDVLLRRGAHRIIALDVGYGQILARLRNDSRVTVLDRVNVRLARPGSLPYAPDLITIDVSFISLKLVLPVTMELAAAQADIVALVKPQFEVGRGQVGKGGIVRDEAARHGALAAIVAFAAEHGLETAGTMESPIAGATGNREFLALFRKSS